MPKERIGEDVTKKKAKGILPPSEAEKFKKWREKREKQKKQKAQEEIKEKMPEEQPTDEQLIKEREKEIEELAKAKKKGLLPVFVREHNRRRPKKINKEELEQ